MTALGKKLIVAAPDWLLTPEISEMIRARKVCFSKEAIVWGAANIANVIGRTEKQTFNMLESGRLPGARKIAGRWAFKPSVFFAAFDAEEVP